MILEIKILQKLAKTWKKEISSSVWSTKHQNAGQNIQQKDLN